MPESSAQSGRFVPIHSAHAIEQVLFVVQFEPTINESQLSEIRKAAIQFKSEGDLPGQVEIQEFAIAFSASGAAPPRLPPGLALQRIAPNGTVENELRIERASLTFRTTLYSRWDEIWSKARRYFETLIPIYSEYSQVRAITLNYVDKFVWEGAVDNCKADLLLQSGSQYLCPHIFGTKEFWHSHTGKFIREDDYVKRLLNVNVDYLEEVNAGDTRRVVSVTTILTDMFNQPGYSVSDVDKATTSSFVDSRMSKLHVFNKEILGDVINQEMSKRIALKG